MSSLSPPPPPPMSPMSTGSAGNSLAGNSLGGMESLGTSKKVIYFVRHAEAEHNVKEREAVAAAKIAGETRKEELEKARKAVLAEDASLKDAPLSQDGIDQVRNSGRRLNKLFASMKPAPRTQVAEYPSRSPLDQDSAVAYWDGVPTDTANSARERLIGTRFPPTLPRQSTQRLIGAEPPPTPS